MKKEKWFFLMNRYDGGEDPNDNEDDEYDNDDDKLDGDELAVVQTRLS